MKNLFLSVMALFLTITVTNAQETLEVNNPKAGKLSSVVKKDSYGTLKKLTITGFLNNKDFEVLANLTNLEELDFSKAELNQLDFKPGKLEYYNGSKLVIPALTSLKKLSVAEGYYELLFSNELPNLKELYVTNEVGVNMPLNLEVYGINDIGGEIIRLAVAYECTFKNVDTWGGKCKLSMYNANKPIKAKYLIFPRNDYFKECSQNTRCYENVFPNIIVCKQEGRKILNHWDDNFDISVLNEITELNNGAFSGSKLTSITLPKAIKKVPLHCFTGCENLQSVNLGEIESIADFAFVGTGLKEITMPSTLRKVYKNTFADSQIKTVVFAGNYPPEIKEYNYEFTDYENNCTWIEYPQRFIVPKGRLSAYNIGAWKRASLREEGAPSGLVLSVKEPGTLAKQITDELAANTEELTIEGLLYDTDFVAIQKCKNLRVLDIGRCFVVKSPETQRADAAEKAMVAFLIGAAVEGARADAKNKYAHGFGSLGEVVQTEVYAELFNKYMANYDADKIEADDQCYLPQQPFEGMIYLEKVVLPKQLKKITSWMDNSQVLTEVVLPPCLEVLDTKFATGGGDNERCDLQIVNFPSTLRVIGNYSFKNCKKLKVVDLSNTKVETIGNETFKFCTSLAVFKGSKYLKEFKSHDATDFRSGGVQGYFYTPEQPKNFLGGSFSTIHIIRGTKAGWPNIYRATLVDDIEE